MKNLKFILIAFLCGITIFCIFKYVSALREKYELLDTLNKTKAQVTSLENEKQNLLQTLEKEKQLKEHLRESNLLLKDYLMAGKNKIVRQYADLARQRKVNDELNSQESLLKAENAALRKNQDDLNFKLERVSYENENLKAKISSIVELKNAIRELKKQARHVVVQIREKAKTIRNNAEGNRGFLVKNGKPTQPLTPKVNKVNIEVNPAPDK